jgi:phage terminase small subunit
MGYRVGAGRPRKPDSELSRPRQKKTVKEKVLTTPLIEADKKVTEIDTGKPVKKTPLEYALDIMNDPSIEEIRRDRMAIAALPFMHMKKGEGGKKDAEKENADKVASGKFAPSAPPKLVVNNK